MKHSLRGILFCSLTSLLSCANTYDILFRSRLPTVEAPIFLRNEQFGVGAQLETERFQVELTKNLISDFRFYKDQDRFSNGTPVFPGVDLAAQLSLDIPLVRFSDEVTVQGEAGVDFAEVKVGYGAVHDNARTPWLWMLGAGYYKTATMTKTSRCGLVCVSSHDTDDASKSIVDGLTTEQDGHEIKISASLGYRFREKTFAYLGFSHMSYHWFAKAFRSAQSETIEMTEDFTGIGYGVGLAHQLNEETQISITVQTAALNWNAQKQERGMGVLNFQVGF